MGPEWVGTFVASVVVGLGFAVWGGIKGYREVAKRRKAARDRFDPGTDDDVREFWDQNTRD